MVTRTAQRNPRRSPERRSRRGEGGGHPGDAGRRVVSGRRRHAPDQHRDRRQRAVRPALSRGAGEPIFTTMAAARTSRSRSRPAPAPTRGNHVRLWLVLGARPGRPAGVARRGDVRPRRGVEPLDPAPSPTTSRPTSTPSATRSSRASMRCGCSRRSTRHQVRVRHSAVRNGGGDRYFTDGEITIGVLSRDAKRRTEAAEVLPSPGVIDFKNDVWSSLRGVLDGER